MLLLMPVCTRWLINPWRVGYSIVIWYIYHICKIPCHYNINKQTNKHLSQSKATTRLKIFEQPKFKVQIIKLQNRWRINELMWYPGTYCMMLLMPARLCAQVASVLWHRLALSTATCGPQRRTRSSSSSLPPLQSDMDSLPSFLLSVTMIDFSFCLSFKSWESIGFHAEAWGSVIYFCMGYLTLHEVRIRTFIINCKYQTKTEIHISNAKAEWLQNTSVQAKQHSMSAIHQYDKIQARSIRCILSHCRAT